MIYAFGDCELDEVRFELRRRGAAVPLEPKTFDVLAYLVKSPDRVVSKDELLDAVWPGQIVSESVLPKCVAAARRVIGDAAIRTVHGRGYRFVAGVARRQGIEAGIGAPVFPLPFVGYEQALERLRVALASAMTGRGRLVLLAGDPGIGKTRTAEELAREAGDRGASVLVGRAYEGEGAPPYWSWIQVLRAAATSTAGAPVRRSVRHGGPGATVAELLGLLEGEGGAAAARAADAEHARFRLFDSIATALRAEAGRQPLVVVLDDLHWADEASLRLLGFIAGEIGTASMLIVATYRELELRRGHPLSTLLGRLARQASCERVVLHGFSRDDTARMIAGVAGVAGATVPDDVAAAVHDMTEGNPFFVQEVARLLVAGGEITQLSRGALDLALPQSVRDAIGRRVDALPAACVPLLHSAAVLGRDFTLPLLVRVAAVADATALELLGDAVHARVLDVTDVPGRYRFHHSLIRQTLYDELSTPERMRLHARAADALEASAGADVESVLDELAYHCFEAAPAGTAERAVGYALRAADRARRRLAYEESARHFERALQIVELHGPGDPARHAELVLATASAQALAGARTLTNATFTRAVELGRALGRADIVARAALGLRGEGEMGSPVEATTRAVLEESLAAVDPTEGALRARLLSRLAGTPPYSESMERRDQLSTEALELARRSAEGVALRDALEARCWACLGPDHLDAREATARELLALADAQRSPHMALLAHDAMFGSALVRGDLGAADRALAAFTHIAEELREPASLFYAIFYQGSRALAGGELARAEQLFRAAQARGRDTVPYAHFMCTAQLYAVRYLRGDDDDPDLERVMFGEMMALPYSWVPALRSSYAFARCVRGEREAAAREFAALMGTELDGLRRDEHWLVTIGALSTLAILLHDRDAAARLYDLLCPYAELVLVHDLLRSINGSVATALGSLAALLGRFDIAERHFADAAAKQAAMGGLVIMSHRSGFAYLLRARDGPGDRERANAVLDELRTEMARCGIRRNWQLDAIDALGLFGTGRP